MWFAIVRIADGVLISHESSEVTQKLTDDELKSKGLTRLEIPEQLPIDKTWNPILKQQENKP